MSPLELLNAAEQFDMATRVDTWVVNAVFDWLSKASRSSRVNSVSVRLICQVHRLVIQVSFFLKEKLQNSEIPLEKIGFEVTGECCD